MNASGCLKVKWNLLYLNWFKIEKTHNTKPTPGVSPRVIIS